MDTGGPWNSPNRPPWMIPAIIAGAVLLLLLLIGGVLAARGRGSSTPTTARSATPTNRIIVAGTPSSSPTRVGGGLPTIGIPGGGAAATAPAGGGAPTAAPGVGTTKGFVVSGTQGEGLILRATPGGSEISVLPEGTRVDQIGPDQDANGMTWHNVRAPDGAEGWVAAQFTTPAP